MHNYPFAALVGQDDLKTALILNALYPAIGGVLIRGERGTAKSTAARALADLLPPIQAVIGCPFNCDPAMPFPDCPSCSAAEEKNSREIPVPFVNLPIGATEDRLLGALDFERALRDGKRAFQPGLLAAAHRGILYIDEVNLLPAHLVDVLLDAAAMGMNNVQREGIAISHPSRFILVGTMNPEEGDLRPQLLDRFGLMIEVVSPRDPEVRSEVVRRRIAFENTSEAFTVRWSEAQESLQQRLIEAQSRLPDVTLADGLLTLISQICAEFEVDGLRADIVLYKTSCALAAWESHTAVTVQDIRRAAEWVLPHRRRRRPFEPPNLNYEQLDNLVNQPPPTVSPTTSAMQAENSEQESEDSKVQNDRVEDSSEVFAPTAEHPVRRIVIASRDSLPRIEAGRRNAVANPKHGHYVRAVAGNFPTDIAIDATLRAAAPRGMTAEGQPIIRPEDLHQKVRASTTGSLILFVVDASGSMVARRRMESVKGAVLSLLIDAYQQRDQVGVIAFSGLQADLLLPPTNSTDLADQALRTLPTGGRTPLAHALTVAAETLEQTRRHNPSQLTLLILLSDGKANVPLPGTTGDSWTQALQAAEILAGTATAALVLDTESGFVRLGRTQALADTLMGEYLQLDELSAETLTLTIKQRLNG